MNPTRIVWVGAAGLVLIVAAVAAIPGAFRFLDRHPWVLTGFAAYVTAIATVLIAAFSKGTWGLFRHEEDRRQARVHLLKREIRGLSNDLREQRATLEVLKDLAMDDAVGPKFIEEELGRVHEELSSMREDVEELCDRAADQSQDVFTPLFMAEDAVRWAALMVEVVDGRGGYRAAIDAARSAEEYLHEAQGKEPPLWDDEEFADQMREVIRRRLVPESEEADD